MSATGLIPTLAGRTSGYAVLPLRDFKKGRREEPTRPPVAATLGEGMQELADCFAAQEPEYIVKQMQAFRSRERINDAGNMTSVSKNLTDEGIANLSHYIGILF